MRFRFAVAALGALLYATPAGADITRAPVPKVRPAVKAETFAKGLVHPWGLQFLPDGRLLVTERPGRMRLIARDGTLSAPLAGVRAPGWWTTAAPAGSRMCR